VAGRYQNLDEFNIRSSKGTYPIYFSQSSDNFDFDAIYIIDNKVDKLQFNENQKIIKINVNERDKNLIFCNSIIEEMASLGITKNHKLIAIGGGFVQDIATLISSLYMRGLKWEFHPTTLAAMGDSCIGGKSSINSGIYKNLIGNFNPPNRIVIDPNYVNSLPIVEKIAGLSEIVKICFATGFEEFITCLNLLSKMKFIRTDNDYSEVIHLSLKCKQIFVEEDEFDVGKRKYLNFGHTFSHALESASNFELPHGVGVAVGMLCAIRHPKSEIYKANKILEEFCLELITPLGSKLQEIRDKLNLEVLKSSLRADKKNSSDKLFLILTSENGLKIEKIPFASNAINEAVEVVVTTLDWILNEIL
jgi:3-dehydroquinate synthase